MSRRRSERTTINMQFDSFDQFIEEYVTNISRSGVFIKTREPLAVGTEIDLRFTVIMDNIETIEGVGQVVRVETNPPGVGVVFRRLSAYSSDLIEKLLTRSGAPGARGEASGAPGTAAGASGAAESSGKPPEP